MSCAWSPGLNGLKLLEWLRGQANQTPFIVFTQGREDLAIQALNLGANHYIKKEGNSRSHYAELAHTIKTTVIHQETVELLRESEEQFRVIYEKSPMGIILFDAKGRFFDANHAALNLFGFNALSALKSIDIFLGDDLDVEERNKLHQGERVRYETAFNLLSLQDPSLIDADKPYSFNLDVQVTSLNPRGPKSPMGYLVQIQDITERKRAEHQVYVSEFRYRNLFECTNDGMLILSPGPSPLILEANQRTEEMLGYDHKELLGLNFEDLFEQSVYEANKRKINLRTGSEPENASACECTILRKDGAPIPIEMNVTTVYDELRNPCHIQAVMRDISERKQAEQALRESEERLRMIFENAQDTILRVDINGIILLANRAIEEYGFEMDKFIGSTMYEWIPEEDWPQITEDLGILAQGKPVEGEVAVRTPIGPRFAIYSTTPIQENGEIIGFQTIMRDNTERKESEIALKRSQQRYWNLFECTNDAMFILSPDERSICLEVNQRAADMLRYSKHELVGRPILDFVEPSEHNNSLQVAQRLLTGETVPIPIYERTLKRKDGTLLTTEVNVALVHDEDGNPLHIQSIIRDISERKQTEHALREMMERYRTILESIDDGYYEVDLAGDLIFFNDSFSQILGYPKDELLGMNYRDYMDSETADMIYQVTNSVFRTEQPARTFDLTFIRKDGGRPFVESSISLIIDSDGEKTGFRGILRDVTERKSAEQALRETEEKYRLIHENIDDGYYEVDLRGTFTFTNDAMSRILGYPQEELIGLNYQEYTDEQTAQLVYQYFNETYRTGKPIKDFNYEIITKDGIKKTIETSVALIADSSGISSGFRGIISDISEKKRAQDALRESEQKYRELVEELHEGVLAEDSKGYITFANPRISSMLGYAEEELIGQHWTVIVPAEEAKRVMEEHANRTYGLSSTFESALLSKNEKIIPVLVSSKPLFTQSWDFRGTLSVYTDLSERKRVEQELARADKLASLGRISAGVAHELNNPLAFISMNTEVLGKCLAGLAPIQHFQTQIEEAIRNNDLSRASEILSDMQSSLGEKKLLKSLENLPSKALENLITTSVRIQQENMEGLERMISIIENLLKFSRSKTTETTRLEMCQISEILRTATNMLKYQLKDSISMKLALDDLPPVLGQADRLTQVFFNILDNAVDAIGDKKPGAIEVTSSLAIGKIEVCIRDNGTGIPEENIPKLFEPFFTTKPPGKGTGLGLSIVHEIIQGHGGQMFVESRLGVGTEVKVTLPIGYSRSRILDQN
ncbi:MAG: PAS domain S-box protein [Candidatus Hodarchaeales archaeon]|jgi:PAS domain S-box-containing protein